ncbi:MAG: T9SS type A sorting domain-containing protein [Bacteroidota bacterium]|nr:T9SS type A sorting domain-containing protein [Bacteroidota bacterium]
MKTQFLIINTLIAFAIQLNTGLGQNKIVDVNIDFQNALLTSSYRAGATHTQYSIDSWENVQANINAKLLLDSSCYYQNQHIMGWGADDPWPDSTVTNSENWYWQSLDNRINLIRETKGVAVITLCACPTWMHTPSMNGQTDWNAIGSKAPTPVHYDDFAHLCAVVARRYPDVLYFQVWNELKGFYKTSGNRWDYENYTRMYNMVYDSLKAVNPKISVGGPYVVMDSWSTNAISNPSNLQGVYGTIDQRALDVIKYWLQNKKGADFITVDGGNDNKDGIWITDGFQASQKFSDVINWIRQQPGGESLPVWWAEWYAWTGASGSKDSDLINAIMADGMVKTITAGYSNIMIWQPQGDAQGLSFPMGLWTDTNNIGGGQPTLYYYTQKGLRDFFSNGAKIYKTSSSPDNIISVMASDKAIVVINHLNEQVKVYIHGMAQPLSLNPYDVRFLSGNFDLATSIENNIKAGHFFVYPNPFTDHLNIEIRQINPELMNIDFYNLVGVKVLSKEYNCNSNQMISISVNTRDIVKGTYLLDVHNHANLFNTVIIKN